MWTSCSDPRRGLTVWRNSGDSRNRYVRVQLKGRVSNRSGVGSKVQIRAGSLTQRMETSAASPAVAPADVVFGLGRRTGARRRPRAVAVGDGAGGDGKPLASTTVVEELDRKPSSCPFLFTWNGERFEFVTDFMGGGEMGYWEGPGRRNVPDPLEYVRIRGDQLRPKDGRYEIRVTNELEETLFADRLQLMSIAHPAGVEVYPNEGMTEKAKPFALLRCARRRGPSQRDRRARPRRYSRAWRGADRQYPDDFELKPFRGYAAEHSLTLDIGTRAATVLLLSGWTDYAFSSDNLAAQPGRPVARAAVAPGEGRGWTLADGGRRHWHSGGPSADGRGGSRRPAASRRTRAPYRHQHAHLLGPGARRHEGGRPPDSCEA